MKVPTVRLEKAQLLLRRFLKLEDFIEPESLSLVAGVDQAFLGEKVISAIVVLDAKSLKPVEKVYSLVKVEMEYVPSFLAFREAKPIFAAYKKLTNRPDVLLIDGNGILHPRLFGLASHVGVVLKVPTVGVAKKLLCGKVKDGVVYLDNKPVGAELFTKHGCKPIYVSPGNMVTLETAVKLVRRFVMGHKLPEPIRLAHNYASEVKRILSQSQTNNNS